MKEDGMKHGKKAQQQRRKLRNKIVEHPDNKLTKDDLMGNSVKDLKEILEKFSLTKEEESSDVSSIIPEEEVKELSDQEPVDKEL